MFHPLSTFILNLFVHFYTRSYIQNYRKAIGDNKFGGPKKKSGSTSIAKDDDTEDHQDEQEEEVLEQCLELLSESFDESSQSSKVCI